MLDSASFAFDLRTKIEGLPSLLRTDEFVRAREQAWITSLQVPKGKVTLQALASGSVRQAGAIVSSRHNLPAYLRTN